MGSFSERLRHFRLVKKCIYAVVGVISYPGLMLINKLKISGTANLENLPRGNVLFVSNHQTYFADVITLLHIFCAVKWGKRDRLGLPFYLLNPFTNVYYVAAEETMKSTFLTRFFAMAGAITVKRTWISKEQGTRRGLDASDTRKISAALDSSWVITFPQGTTTPFAPGRKGTAFIIKQHRPVVMPVVIDGFRKAFDKKGLKLRKRGTLLTVNFKAPLQIDYEQSVEEILATVMKAIEQSREFEK